ncbi:MAG: right-handed parallel beta-helix repeat-containing protein, partial [Victivallaceae bacterium]|nr:right-handed parallel beta-helix repeat-containing protein [Victivallaceae bacterium]
MGLDERDLNPDEPYDGLDGLAGGLGDVAVPNNGETYTSQREVTGGSVSFENDLFFGIDAADGALHVAGGTVVVGSCTFSDNTGAIVNAGAVTIEDSTFATELDTVYNTGTMTFGGTVWTAANITSDNAITVEPETELVLDISSYAGMTGRELLTDFYGLFRNVLYDLCFSINVAENQAFGKYCLATDVRMLPSNPITLLCEGSEIGTFDMNHSWASYLEKNWKSYALDASHGNLVLCVRDAFFCAIVTTDGDSDSVVIGDVTYSGVAYSGDDIERALDERNIVVVHGGTYEGTGLDIGIGQVFVADSVSMSGIGKLQNVEKYWAIASDSGTVSISNCDFFGNTVAMGAVYSEYGCLSVHGSTFTGNVALEGGGAIYNTGGTATIADCVFIGNNANVGGAVYGRGVVEIKNCIFVDNTSPLEEGGIEASGTMSVSGSTFSGNSGAIRCAVGTVAIRDSVFATGSDLIWCSDLLLGGTIWAAAEIRSYYTFAVEADTELVLDISAADHFSKFLCTYDNMSRKSQDNLSITINIARNQAEDKYVIISEASSFDLEKTISVICDGDTLGVGNVGSAFVGNGYEFAFSMDECDNVVFTIRDLLDTAIVTADGGTDSVVIDGVTYSGRAYAGDEIAQALAAQSTVVVRGVSYDETSLRIEGQLFVADAVSMSNGSDSSILCLYRGTASISNSNFFGNTASFSGAINNYDIATISNSTFSQNVGCFGGAIYNEGIATVENNVFAGNTGVFGAAVNNTVSAEMTISNCMFYSNEASAEYEGEGIGIVYNEGTMSMSGSTFSGNVAIVGGAIASVGELTVSSCDFSGNTVTSVGGAIYNNDTATITDSTFTGNTAIEGGAIYNGGTVTIEDSTFATETDTIYSVGGTIIFGGTIWTAANITSDSAITVEPETELVLDVSVYAGSTTRELLTDYDTMFSSGSQDDLSISICIDRNQGEGVYVLATEAAGFDTGKTISVICDGSVVGTLTPDGMAFTYGANDYTLEVHSSLELTVSQRDVAIVTADGGTDTVVVDGVTYSGVAYGQDDIDTIPKNTVVVQGVSYTGRKVNAYQRFILDSVSMTESASGRGGAIESSANNVSVFGSTFSCNTASIGGGAICNFAQGHATVSGSLFSDNVASRDGGAIFSDGVVSIAGGSFFRNYARDGGAILAKGEMAISGSTFSCNTANLGGAIQSQGCISSISDSIFAGNVADNGGVMYADGPNELTISKSMFLGNTAAQWGGVIHYTRNFTLTISGSTFSGNVADVGGAIYAAGGVVTIKDSVFATETDTVCVSRMTFGGTIWTAANITSNNAITVEPETEPVLAVSVYAGPTTRQLLTGY